MERAYDIDTEHRDYIEVNKEAKALTGRRM